MPDARIVNVSMSRIQLHSRSSVAFFMVQIFYAKLKPTAAAVNGQIKGCVGLFNVSLTESLSEFLWRLSGVFGEHPCEIGGVVTAA